MIILILDRHTQDARTPRKAFLTGSAQPVYENCYRITKNHRISWAERDLQRSLNPAPGPAQDTPKSLPVPESAVLELWQPWGSAHALGSLFCAPQPSGGRTFTQTKPPWRSSSHSLGSCHRGKREQHKSLNTDLNKQEQLPLQLGWEQSANTPP